MKEEEKNKQIAAALEDLAGQVRRGEPVCLALVATAIHEGKPAHISINLFDEPKDEVPLLAMCADLDLLHRHYRRRAAKRRGLTG